MFINLVHDLRRNFLWNGSKQHGKRHPRRFRSSCIAWTQTGSFPLRSPRIWNWLTYALLREITFKCQKQLIIANLHNNNIKCCKLFKNQHTHTDQYIFIYKQGWLNSLIMVQKSKDMHSPIYFNEYKLQISGEKNAW